MGAVARGDRRDRRQADRSECHQPDGTGGDRRADWGFAGGARGGLRAGTRRIAHPRRRGYVMRMPRIAAAGILAAGLACGSGSGSTGATLNGVVRGQPMKPVDAVSSPARVSLGAISADVAAIVLSDVSGVCPEQSAVATSGAVKLTSVSAGGYAGTYTIGLETGEQITGEFHAASCPGLATYLATPTHSCGG